ncbi:carbohydrate ABC transporter permease [Streptomyces coerulescens]|uniref:Carbohydrate ABC transporter permease n=1 Tax=Streptomyces coerulescens TaxID=29304 RepID=A0ABW0D0T9_STRCD
MTVDTAAPAPVRPQEPGRREVFQKRGRPVARPLRRVAHYTLLVAVLILVILPMAWMVITSLRGTGENIYGAASPLPQQPTLGAYQSVFDSLPIGTYILNTTVVEVLAITSECLFSAFAGYALSRKGWFGRRAALTIILVALLIPFEAIMVSLFVIVNDIGLVDSLWGVWLPAFVTPVNVLIMRAAFMAIPDELEEAAVLDGANDWLRFWRVFLPSARGAVAVVAVTTFVATWDNFLWPLLVLRSDTKYTLTLGLAQLSNSEFGYDERLVMAGATIAMIPVLVLFGFAQRYFFRGVGEGALKM